MLRASEPVEILLVADNPHDVELTLHALREHHLANRIHVPEPVYLIRDNGVGRGATFSFTLGGHSPA